MQTIQTILNYDFGIKHHSLLARARWTAAAITICTWLAGGF